MLDVGEQVEQRRLLRAEADPAGDPDLAGIGAQDARADPQQRRLARPVLAGECDRLAPAHLEVDAVEHGVAAVPLHDAGRAQRGVLDSHAHDGRKAGWPARRGTPQIRWRLTAFPYATGLAAVP